MVDDGMTSVDFVAVCVVWGAQATFFDKFVDRLAWFSGWADRQIDIGAWYLGF